MSNERANVQIDRFFGDPMNSTGRLSHGGLFIRTILRNGDPVAVGPAKCPFSEADGMTGRALLVMLMPMTMAAPHTHVPGTDEI